MKRKFLILALMAGLFAMVMAGCGQSPSASHSDDRVDVDKYTMDLKLDTEKKTLSGTVIIDLANQTEETIDEICIRNYAALILSEKGKGSSEIRSGR